MGRKYFFNVSKGVFSERKDEGKPQIVCNSIAGHLVNITFSQTVWGEVMRLHVVDQENFYMLSMYVKSRTAYSFLMLVPNLDLNHVMDFNISAVAGKDNFAIWQYGLPVKWYYIGENSKPVVQIRKDDTTDNMLEILRKDYLPILQKKLNPYPFNKMYKPMRPKGLQGGYFSNEKTSVYMKGVSADENKPGFGKSINY